MLPARELIDRAIKLAPKIAASANSMDAARTIDGEIFDNLVEAGFLEILAPREFGGLEYDIDTLCAVTRIIAEASPSAAHVLMFFMEHTWLHSLFSIEAQREAFGEKSHVLSAGTIAPAYKLVPVKGGYLATGKTAWASGINHADWVLASGFIEGRDRADGPATFFVSRDEVEVANNWHVLGQRATGSNDIAINDIFVPEHRILMQSEIAEGVTAGAAHHDNPLYSKPMMPITQCAMCSILVGAYSGAVKELAVLTRRRAGTWTGAKLADMNSVQIRLGKSAAWADILNILLDELITAVKDATAEELRDASFRINLKARSTIIADTCRSAINDLVVVAGADALRDGSPIQGHFRDINMLCQHATFNLDAALANYGKSILGLPVDAGY